MKRVLVVSQTIATIPVEQLGQADASLDADHDEMTCALDISLLDC